MARGLPPSRPACRGRRRRPGPGRGERSRPRSYSRMTRRRRRGVRTLPRRPAPSRPVSPCRTSDGFTVAAVTVAAAVVGLVLEIRAEQYAGREDRRAAAQDRRDREGREEAYPDLVDFYATGSEVIVVNGSSRVMAMRLTLPASKVRWDLDLLRPCRQIAVPSGSLLRSMAVRQPALRLQEADLAQLRLEFKDPTSRAWIRSSGGAPARLDAWVPSGRPHLVSAEVWNVSAQDAPQCDGS